MNDEGSSNPFVLTGAFQSNKYLAKPSAERRLRLRGKQKRIIDNDVSYEGKLEFCDRIDVCERGVSVSECFGSLLD
jgi:hypothetical protein